VNSVVGVARLDSTQASCRGGRASHEFAVVMKN